MSLVEGMFLVEACTEAHLISIIARDSAGREVSTGSAYYEYILRFTGAKAAPPSAELMQRGYLPVSLDSCTDTPCYRHYTTVYHWLIACQHQNQNWFDNQ
jgi:hypothetical protein